MNIFNPNFTVTNHITAGLTRIERARGFLEAATLSENWVREMGKRALVLEAHHTTHIEGTENCVFNSLGRGNWQSSNSNALSGVEWAKNPWESLLLPDSEKAKSQCLELGDPIIPGNEPYCGSSTDLSILGNDQFDLVITNPPFGNNLFYTDLADFFYVWLRIPLRKWYAGLPEAAYFESERAHRSLEEINNLAEHPDDRMDYEKEPFIDPRHLARITELTGDHTLLEKNPKPLYRPQPSSDFYSQTLFAVWARAGHRLKDGGIMAFTF